MKNNQENDDFHSKLRHINTLFQFLKSNKDEQFMEYITALDKEEIDINTKDETGNFLISFAIIKNNKRILKKILEYGARVDIFDSDGYSILHYPIKYNYIEIIDILINHNKTAIGISLLNLPDNMANVPIFYAIKYKNRYALQELLSNGADANYKNNKHITPLQLAVLKKDITMVKMLIKYVKNIDAITLNGSTALHYACNFELIEIVKILLENGANQNIIEFEYDFCPIFYPVVQNNVEITKLLINHKANPNHQDYNGNTIVHYAIINNHIEILDYILSNYSIRKRDENIYIEDINNRYITKEFYINPNLANIEGITITHLLLYTYKETFDKYLEIIIPYSNLNYQDNSGNTILHLLAMYNLWEKFAHIINVKKMNIFIKNNENKNIIDIVHLQYREKFLNIIIQSYYAYLKKYENGWLLDWQNSCSGKNSTKIQKSECYTNIRNAIIKENMSIPIKKNKKNINISNTETVQFSTFTGSLLDMLVGFKYLTKKYPFVSSIFHSSQEHNIDLEKYNQTLGIQDNPHQHIIHFEIRWLYQKIFFPPKFENIFLHLIKSNKYKYIIIPIGIILSNGYHSNSLIYDIQNHIMERFEPHGSNYPTNFNYNPELLDEILYKKISNIIRSIYQEDISIKYYQPKNYMPKIGFQIFDNAEVHLNKNIGDPNGFCTLWTIWYMDYRMMYSDIHPSKLIKKLIKEIRISNIYFRTIIRNYSKIITDLRDRYLSKINRNINDYLNNRLSQKELKQILVEILVDNEEVHEKIE